MELLWRDLYAEHYARLESLVLATKGIYLAYEEAPIEAAFFSLSSGRTRDFTEITGKETVDGTSYPYLVAVSCENDIFSEQFVHQKVYSNAELHTLLSEFLLDDELEYFTSENLKILERDSSGYALQVQVGDQIIPGEQFRELLELASACFMIQIEGEEKSRKILFTTNGIGLGVGMSQHEANAKALDLESFQVILEYFFPGTQLKKN